MIKRYNQFVTGKVNEDFDMKPEVDLKKPTLPSFGKKPQVAPTASPAEIEGEFSGEEEEVAVDKYEMALQNLADAAGVEFTPGQKSVEINGKEVTFPAETEKYHIKGVKKSFATPEDVLSNIGGSENVPTERKQEVKDELTSIKDEEVIDPSEQFESKSYKYRRFKQ